MLINWQYVLVVMVMVETPSHTLRTILTILKDDSDKLHMMYAAAVEGCTVKKLEKVQSFCTAVVCHSRMDQTQLI